METYATVTESHTAATQGHAGVQLRGAEPDDLHQCTRLHREPGSEGEAHHERRQDSARAAVPDDDVRDHVRADELRLRLPRQQRVSSTSLEPNADPSYGGAAAWRLCALCSACLAHFLMTL